MEFRYLLIAFVLLFVMGCNSHRRHRTTVIICDGRMGARLEYIGNRNYHHSPCYIYNCNHCRTRVRIIKHFQAKRHRKYK